MNYKNTAGSGKVFNRRIKERICNLSRALGSSGSAEEFKEKIDCSFIRSSAVGLSDFIRHSG